MDKSHKELATSTLEAAAGVRPGQTGAKPFVIGREKVGSVGFI